MSKKIKKAYTDNPTAGDDTTTEGYTPFDDGSADELARSDTQLAEIVRVRLGLGAPPAQPGDTTAPTITAFIGTVTIDSLDIGIEIQADDNVGITGWIIKEDDTDLPASDDTDWDSSTITTFEVSDYNPHNLTLRTRDAALNVSTPFTITVTPTQTSATVPTADTFTTTNPAGGSKDYTFTMTATASSGETISHYLLTEDSLVQPLAGDSGWQADTSPWVGVAASLTNLADTDVRIYVKDTGGLVSTGLLSHVTVSQSGETAANGDWLWENDPQSIVAYDGAQTFDIQDGTTTNIDGLASDKGYMDGTALALEPLIEFNTTDTIASATINITNMHFEKGRQSLLYFVGLDNVTINIRNCWFGESWTLGEDLDIASSQQLKGQQAIRMEDCDDCTFNVYGNFVDGSDGFMFVNNCDSTTLNVKNTWMNGFVNHNAPGTEGGSTNIGAIQIWWGSVNGEISQNICYRPQDSTDGEDLFSFNGGVGTELSPLLVTRNRVWGDWGTNAGTNACFQIGDTNQVVGAASKYINVIENTVIDYNTPLSMAGGKNCKMNNNKTYTSKEYPARYAGIMAFIAGRSLGISPGNFYGAEVTNNTCLHYYDAEDGSAVTAKDKSDIWFPSVGNDGLVPNHGTLAQGNVDPDGYANNDWQHLAWADGQGKSELWRSSWNSFRYAGADGLTPSISYDSPWIGDGGSQGLTATNISSNTAYGDQSTEGDGSETHDWAVLVSGGTAPVTLTSVSTSTPTIITVSVVNQTIVFTPDTDGPFTYQYTVTDSVGDTATGTISGTVLAVSATKDYFDQDGLNYIAINPVNYDELYNRGLHTWDAGGTAGPYGTGEHMTVTPYSHNIAVGDIETDSPEMVYRVHFDQAGTYDIFIMGMALGSAAYDSCWVGWNDVADTNHIFITTDDSVFYWAAAERGPLVVATNDEEHDLHVWMREGGFALGAIEVHIQGSGTPKVADSTTTPHAENDRNPF